MKNLGTEVFIFACKIVSIVVGLLLLSLIYDIWKYA